MSKSVHATGKPAQSHQLHQEENNKRMISPSKSSQASASQQQSYHSRMTNENLNAKSQCRRDSQSAQQNSKSLYRSESASGHQFLLSASKCRNDHKTDNYHQDQSNNSNRCNNDQRPNGAPMTDIYADVLAEVTIKIELFSYRNIVLF